MTLKKRKKEKLILKYYVGICGHYGGKKVFLDGQTVKTKNVTSELIKKYGQQRVVTVDTYGGVKSLLKCLKKLHFMLKNCENIIILPAHNSIKIFPFFLVVLNQFYHRKLHYIVIGGWLPEFVKSNYHISKVLKRLDYIYVETSTMQKELVRQGFKNIIIMPNFKRLNIISSELLSHQYAKPFRLCTFSRVMKQKGVEDVIDVVNKINDKRGQTIFKLDIYGQIDSDYEEDFNKLKEEFSTYVKYRGAVPAEKSVDILRDYFALVFPTHFYTEGIPGTIIDAYAAGVPVIASKWESFKDVIEDGITGFGYEFGNKAELQKRLEYIADNPKLIINMKSACIEKADQFMPENAILKMKL